MGFEVPPQDFVTIGLIVLLEGILSIDNALAIAVIARKLPRNLQRRAVTYGLVGAIIFRVAAISSAAYLMHWGWVKYLGGGHLCFMAARHWIKGEEQSSKEEANQASLNFWKAVFVIELTDMAFAVDSILAAVAVTSKLWIVITGGLLGLVMMRFAATFFIALLNRFPNFENTAYLLVFTIGFKLILEGVKKHPFEIIPGMTRISDAIQSWDFHSPSSPAFYVFWFVVVASILYGFKPRAKDIEVRANLALLKKEEQAVADIESVLDEERKSP